jgi:glutamate carboxypeptidase
VWYNVGQFSVPGSLVRKTAYPMDIHNAHDDYATRYLPVLRSYQDEAIERLQLLVNIDSGSGQAEGVNRVMLYLREWMSALDFSVTLHGSEQFGNNLVARRRGKGTLCLLLIGHVDTVYPPSTASLQPFSLNGEVASGPGVIDMKSGIVMGVYALRALLESGFDNFGEIVICWNNDEEVGSPGSAPLLRELAREVDVALVLEPTRSAEILTQARKGADKYILEVAGIPAHSGAEPHKGRSAVIELAHKMLAIHSLNSLFPGTTFNVTRLSSSEPLNVVPDMARCHISVRAYEERSLQLASETLEQIAAGSSVPGTHARLVRTRGRTPYTATPEVLRLVEMARQEGIGLGLDIVAERKGGVSDANVLMECGIPTLDSLGPVGGGMHDINREHLRIDSLPVRGALLAGLIHRLCLSEITGDKLSA